MHQPAPSATHCRLSRRQIHLSYIRCKLSRLDDSRILARTRLSHMALRRSQDHPIVVPQRREEIQPSCWCMDCTDAAKMNFWFRWKMFDIPRPKDFSGYWNDRTSWEKRQNVLREEGKTERRQKRMSLLSYRADSLRKRDKEIEGCSER